MLNKTHVAQNARTQFQHDDWPTCECDVMKNVWKSVIIARLPMRMRMLAAERLQIVCEA